MNDKICPLLKIAKSSGKLYDSKNKEYCKEGECAWWAKWQNCCAVVAIPAELADRLEEIRNAVNE